MNQPAANKIMETFYHRMLPMFTPQAERFLDNVSPEDISPSAFRYTFSVEAMVTISRIIENAIISIPRTADTFLMRYWFVVAFGPGIGMSLLAEKISSLRGNERYYEGFFTFEPGIAYQLLAILHQNYSNDIILPISPEMMKLV
jgi:hypothetical protein